MNEPRFDSKRGVLENFASWDQVYRMLAANELPWNAGGPDPDLTRIIESGKIPVGAALDFGTGPGHDAVYLAKKGYRVTAIDISAKAIELAKASARVAGVESSITFLVQDILSMPLPTCDLINDRGFFHVISPDARGLYVNSVARALSPDGRLFLRVFSDKEAPAPGPHRFSRKQLEDVFSPLFSFEEFREGVFEGSRRPKAYFCLLRKISG